MTNLIGRTFGVEIETVGIATTRAQEAIRDAGADAFASSSHASREYSTWLAKPDGSLESPNGRSAEVVSPVLEWGNLDHYRQVETVCSALRDAGARVNPSCGLHVHVGVGDLTYREIVGIAKVYTAAQDSIDANVSPSRRNGRWCRRLPAWGTTRTDDYYGRTWDDFQTMFLDRGRSPLDRYVAVNLHPYPDRGTVEFRQRNGSLNARKILTWAGLMMSVVKAGAEDEMRSDLTPYTEAGQADTGVWEMLNDRWGALDPHALIWRDGSRPAPVEPTPAPFSRLLDLQRG